MPKFRASILLLCGLLLGACSDEPPVEKPKENTGHVWQGQVEMLNEAKQVGQEVNALQQQKEQRLKELD